jgi:hypothetical protein
MEKEGRGLVGFFFGVLIMGGLLSIIATIYYALHPDERYKPNYYLNSPEWTIDTIRTSSAVNNSTTIEYKFIQTKN